MGTSLYFGHPASYPAPCVARESSGCPPKALGAYTHMADPRCSRHLAGDENNSSPAVVATWGVDQQIQDLSLCCLFQYSKFSSCRFTQDLLCTTTKQAGKYNVGSETHTLILIFKINRIKMDHRVTACKTSEPKFPSYYNS